jgi:hypothetical protein
VGAISDLSSYQINGVSVQDAGDHIELVSISIELG